MNQNQKNIALCEAQGWKPTTAHGGVQCWIDPTNGLGVKLAAEHLPQHFKSLDACAQAREYLTSAQKKKYCSVLRKVIAKTVATLSLKFNPRWHLVDASAAQHAECLGIVLGLWK